MRVADYEARFIITSDAQYGRMAAEATFTLALAGSNARINIMLYEPCGGDSFGFSVMPACLAERPLDGPALLCDADVHFYDDPLDVLGRSWHWDVAARPATSVQKRRESEAAWDTVKDQMDVTPSAVLLNDGVVFLQAAAAEDLSAQWLDIYCDVRNRCEDVLNSQAGPRPGRYFATMYAFSIWAAELKVRFLNEEEVGFAWDGEPPGSSIYHYGTRYWKSWWGG